MKKLLNITLFILCAAASSSIYGGLFREFEMSDTSNFAIKLNDVEHSIQKNDLTLEQVKNLLSGKNINWASIKNMIAPYKKMIFENAKKLITQKNASEAQKRASIAELELISMLDNVDSIVAETLLNKFKKENILTLVNKNKNTNV